MIIEIVPGHKINTDNWTRVDYLAYKRKLLQDASKLPWIEAKPMMLLVNKIDALLAYAD
jgi:hypothetical protein